MSPIASNVKLTKTLRTVALLAAIALAAALGACSAPSAQEKAQQAQPEPLVVNDTPAPPVPGRTEAYSGRTYSTHPASH